jgi:hypothetical protein
MTTAVRANEQPGQEVRRIVDSMSFVDWYLLEKIKKAARLQKAVGSFEPQVKEIKDTIVTAALDNGDLSEDGSVTYIVDGILCRVSSGYDYSIPNTAVAGLMEALGVRFGELVEARTIFTPTPRLIEMACDADRGAEIRKHLTICLRAPQVSIIQECGEKGAGT